MESIPEYPIDPDYGQYIDYVYRYDSKTYVLKLIKFLNKTYILKKEDTFYAALFVLNYHCKVLGVCGSADLRGFKHALFSIYNVYYSKNLLAKVPELLVPYIEKHRIWKFFYFIDNWSYKESKLKQPRKKKQVKQKTKEIKHSFKNTPSEYPYLNMELFNTEGEQIDFRKEYANLYVSNQKGKHPELKSIKYKVLLEMYHDSLNNPNVPQYVKDPQPI